MSFTIAFSREPVPREPVPEEDMPKMFIIVRINDEVTTFAAPINFWGPGQYIVQWRDGIARILRGARSSCLLTGVRNPALHHGVTMVELHREGSDVFARERYVFADRIPDDFDPRNPYGLVGPHPAVHVEPNGEVRVLRGTRVPLGDIAAFAATFDPASPTGD